MRTHHPLQGKRYIPTITYLIIANTQKINLFHFKEHRPSDKGDNSYLRIPWVTSDNIVN